MLVIGSLMLYYSYLRVLQPGEIEYQYLALVTLLLAGVISLYRAVQMRRIAKKYNILSLRTNALNSIKDGVGSFVAFLAVLIASLGFKQMDGVGGMIIGGYILTVAYVSIKESSLVLMDACQRPELIDQVKSIISVNNSVDILRIRLRVAGSILTGTVNLAADGNLTLYQVSDLKAKIRQDLKSKMVGLGDLSILVQARRRTAEPEIL